MCLSALAAEPVQIVLACEQSPSNCKMSVILIEACAFIAHLSCIKTRLQVLRSATCFLPSGRSTSFTSLSSAAAGSAAQSPWLVFKVKTSTKPSTLSARPSSRCCASSTNSDRNVGRSLRFCRC